MWGIERKSVAALTGGVCVFCAVGVSHPGTQQLSSTANCLPTRDSATRVSVACVCTVCGVWSPCAVGERERQRRGVCGDSPRTGALTNKRTPVHTCTTRTV